MTYIEEHLEELVAQYADEDNCTPEVWRLRALLSVVRTRYCMGDTRCLNSD